MPPFGRPVSLPDGRRPARDRRTEAMGRTRPCSCQRESEGGARGSRACGGDGGGGDGRSLFSPWEGRFGAGASPEKRTAHPTSLKKERDDEGEEVTPARGWKDRGRVSRRRTMLAGSTVDRGCGGGKRRVVCIGIGGGGLAVGRTEKGGREEITWGASDEADAVPPVAGQCGP